VKVQLTHLYHRWWWGHWITNFLISGPLVIAAWVMGHKAYKLSDAPMDHHKVRRTYVRVPTPQHLLDHRSRTLTFRSTENWLCYLWSVHRTGGPRGVHPLRSLSTPFPRRSPAAPELHPCTPGSDYPCHGKLPGSSLSVYPHFSFEFGKQVHYGIYIQWPRMTGNIHPVKEAAKHAWLALVIVSRTTPHFFLTLVNLFV
jgi:hypothetical protein